MNDHASIGLRLNVLRFALLAAFTAPTSWNIVRADHLASVNIAAETSFNQHVLPILKQHCYECHSHEAGKAKGGLVLDSRSGWAKGGESGPAVVPGKPGESATDRHGRACLMARRLSEAGVRFLQITIDGWDHHGDIRHALPRSCAGADRPIAGLIRDWKRRGLLEETLIVISREFGRTYWSQDLSGTSPIAKHGREHQQESFCTLLAGGGVKRGFVHGETDDFGYRPILGRVHLHDLHATLLYLLGLDHERLTYPHLGRDYRLTDVYGRVVHEVIA